MTTQFHTPIVAGEDNSPATVNTRLGALDDAIGDVDTRVDTLILNNGASDAEVIDTRNGYTLLNNRINDLTLKTKVLFVDAGYTNNPGANRFTTISGALAVCVGGETIKVAPGIYAAHLTIADDNITIVGSGMPEYDVATARLVGGTIIRGRILTGVVSGLTIRDLGVDVADYPTNAYDCIGATNAAFEANRTYVNLALLGNKDNTTGSNWMHGLYIVGSNTVVSNVRVYRCYHGIAVHGQRVSLDNLYFYNNYGTSLVIKGKQGFDVHSVNVTNVVIEGTTSYTNGRAGPIEIQNADATNTYDVTITNVTAYECILGVFQCFLGEGDGSVHDISLSNCISRNARNSASLGDYRIKHVAGLTLTNCQSFNRNNGYAFLFDSTPITSNVRLYQCSTDSSGNGAYSTNQIPLFNVLEVNGIDALIVKDNAFTGQNSFNKSMGLYGSKASVPNNSATNIATLVVGAGGNLAFSVLVTLVVAQGATLGTYSFIYTNAFSIETVTLLAESKFSQTSCSLTASMSTGTRTSTLTVTQVSGAAATVEICVTTLMTASNQGLILTML